MPDVDTFCTLVSRLTGPQRSLLVQLPAWGSPLFVMPPTMEVGHLRGLHIIGLVERHSLIPALFQRSRLGEAVAEALLDTEVIVDVG